MSEANANPGPGVVYTETTVYSAPEQYMNEAPYQIAIVALDAGGRLTARIAGEAVSIGDRVQFIEYRNQFPVFQK
ncbi:MAG: OB-fold domain-containing protein [Bryobacterales bacterium]|nr:OB-fold domain-containing protein [Bryobacterales bacterium]